MNLIFKTIATTVVAASMLALSACEPPRDTTRDGQWGTGDGTQPRQSADIK